MIAATFGYVYIVETEVLRVDILVSASDISTLISLPVDMVLLVTQYSNIQGLLYNFSLADAAGD